MKSADEILDQLGVKSEPRSVRETRELRELVDGYQPEVHGPFERPEEVPEESSAAPEARTAASGRRIVLTRASEIEPEPVTWAWEENGQGRIPAGSLGLGAGREGTGKSSHSMWMAARITTGTLPGSFQGSPRAVIYVAVEDSWKFTIVPRLMAAGADLDLVFRAEVRIDEDESATLSLPADNRQLEAAIREYGVALVVLDPLMSAIGSTLDTHRNREVRKALDPLAAIADRTGAVIWGICHFSKGNGTDASSLITGSGAFKDVARAILAFARDDEDGTQVITQTKNSLGQLNLPSLEYRIVSAKVETRKGVAEVGRFVLDGHSDRRVQDILGYQGGPDEREERKQAAEWLHDFLERQGETSANEVFRAGGIEGYSKDTLKRSKAAAGAESRKASFGAGWVWALIPQDAEGSTKGAKGAMKESLRSSLPSVLPSSDGGADVVPLHSHGDGAP